MRKQLIMGAFVLAALVGVSSVPAHAQKGIELFGGYSYATSNGNSGEFDCFECTTSGGGLHGYDVAAVYNVNRHLGAEVNFSGHNGDNTVFNDIVSGTTSESEILHTDSAVLTFGPKFTEPVGNFDLFAHALVGVNWLHQDSTDCSDGCEVISSHGSGFAMVLGGGVDSIHSHWVVRIAELDYVHTDAPSTFHFSADPNESELFGASGDNIRLVAGIGYRFGMQTR